MPWKQTLLLTLLLSCSAQPWVQASVEAYAAPLPQLENLHSFEFQSDPTSPTALRDRALFEKVGSLLQLHGLHQSDHAEIKIQLQASTEVTTLEIPSHYELGHTPYSSYYQYSYVLGGDGNHHPILLYYPSYWQSSAYRVPARSVPAYAHHFHLDFLDANETLLWQGSIDILDRSHDLVGLLELFLPQLLQEFPIPSGKGVKRKARRKNQSTLTTKES